MSGNCPARRTLTSTSQTARPEGGLYKTHENLLARFELGGDQTNLVNSGAAHNVDSAGDVHDQYIVVAFDKSDFLSALLNNPFPARAEAFPSGFLVLYLDLAFPGTLHTHRPSLTR